MRSEARNHIVQPIAIHVIGVHLCPALREGEFVKRPNRITFEGSGLFPPAVLFEDIFFSVPVHIADSHAVSEFAVLVIR